MRALADESPAQVVDAALEAIADDTAILNLAMGVDGVILNDDIVARSISRLESRIRVVREVARRIEAAR